MNILYLCADRGIPIRGHKGAAVHVRALAEAFTRAGHTVTILTPRAGPADGPAPLAALVEVPLPPAVGDDAPARDRQSQAYAEVLYRAALEQLTRHPSDFIYERYSLWSDVGARLSQATGLPLVLEVNAPLVLEASQYRSLTDHELARQIEAVQFQGAAAISVVSEAVRDYVIAHGAATERVRVLTNGVDPEHFHPAVRGGAVRARWGLDDRIVLGFVGRPRPWHDLETLLAATARLRAEDARYHLLLVGEMPDDLASRLAAHGLPAEAVTLTGPVAHTAVPEHIAAMDVAVSPHPDLPDFYFSPLKLFEYMACGVPTVASAVGQPARLIRDGETGCLYPAGDAAALADRIRALLAQPDRARDIAWAGAAHVLAQHTWDGNARAVADWIRPAPPQPEPDPTVWPRPVALPILDAKLRQRLYRASRADLAAPLLARRLPGVHKHQLEIVGVQVLKYKAGRRCVLAYDLADGARPGHTWRVIGKVYRDERGERLQQLQEHLWRAGFGPEAADGVSVPRALAYVPEMRMLVQACAAGATFNDLITQADPRALARRSAAGLAKLHAAALPPAELPVSEYGVAAELDSLERFAAELTRVRPAETAEVADLHAALQAWGRQLPEPPAATLVHRDFYYSQVLFDGPRLTLIDFDLLARGDPAIDVANFAAHLVFLGLDRLGDPDALADAADLFRSAYAGRRPADAGFEARFAFYEAATFFRLMNVVASRPGLAQHFAALRACTRQRLAARAEVV